MTQARQKITESLLIRACVADDDNFEEVFRSFERDGSLDDLNEGTLRLIPFLYRRLERMQVDASNLGILKGIYARYWYLHHMFRSHGLGLSAEFLGDIPFLVMKGQAFQQILYGADSPTRPGDDTDILVPTERASDALGRLTNGGFLPKFARTRSERLRVNPSTGLGRDGVDIDLHWQIYPPASGADGVDVVNLFFERSISFSSQGRSFRTLSIDHHLAHTLVHGWGKNDVSPIRWVLDAAHLIRHRDLNWDQFSSDVTSLGWHSVVASQLQELLEEFNLPVPTDVIRNLAGIPTNSRQKLLLHHPLMQKGPRKMLHSLVWVRPLYFRATTLGNKPHLVVALAGALAISIVGLVYRLAYSLRQAILRSIRKPRARRSN
jgi:hypothetical protein